MTAPAKKTAKPDFDLSNFAIDDDVSLWDAAPDVPLPPAEPATPVTPVAPASPTPIPTPLASTAPVAPARAPEPIATPVSPIASTAPSAPLLPTYVLPGRATRVAATYWISPELRRAIRQAMIGSLEGVYRSQGDLVEAAMRRFLNLG